MRFFIAFCCLLTVQSVTAQDFCKLVKTEISPNKVQFDYASPYKFDEVPAIRVKRSVSIDEDYPYDNFTMMFHVACPLGAIYNKHDDGGQDEKNEKSLIIVFEDNSKIVDDTVEVSHDFTEDRTEATRYIFYPLIPETIEELSTKKISKFIIAGQERLYPADSANAIMQFVKCIKEARK
jgi:hypothetical protein